MELPYIELPKSEPSQRHKYTEAHFTNSLTHSSEQSHDTIEVRRSEIFSVSLIAQWIPTVFRMHCVAITLGFGTNRCVGKPFHMTVGVANIDAAKMPT